MIQKSTFNFLAELDQNNNRNWFNANKVEYQNAKADFTLFIDALIDSISEFDHHLEGLTAHECIFRVYRDSRFSKIKEPYKTNFGAYIAFGGKKAEYAGYFVHLKPNDCFIGGGLYKPNTAVLRKIRQEIDYNPKQLKQILSNQDFVETYGEIQGEKLASAPKGFPKDHPEIELLKFKSYFVMHHLQDETFTQSNAIEQCSLLFEKLHPFNRFFNETFVS